MQNQNVELASWKPFAKKLVYGNSQYRDASFMHDFDDWDESAIGQRQEDIANRLCRVWKVAH